MIGEYRTTDSRLRALYHCENDNDAMGSYNLTNTGVSTTQGRFGLCYNKDADTDKMQYGGDLGFATSNDFSILLWVKKNASYTSAWRITVLEVDNQRYYTFQWTSDTNINLSTSSGSGNFTLPNDGKWHRIGFSRNGSTNEVRMYCDGIFMATFTMGTTNAGSTVFTMFSQYNQTNNATRCNIDEFIVANKVLTDAEFRKDFLFSTGRML